MNAATETEEISSSASIERVSPTHFASGTGGSNPVSSSGESIANLLDDYVRRGFAMGRLRTAEEVALSGLRVGRDRYWMFTVTFSTPEVTSLTARSRRLCCSRSYDPYSPFCEI